LCYYLIFKGEVLRRDINIQFEIVSCGRVDQASFLSNVALKFAMLVIDVSNDGRKKQSKCWKRRGGTGKSDATTRSSFFCWVYFPVNSLTGSHWCCGYLSRSIDTSFVLVKSDGRPASFRSAIFTEYQSSS